MKNLTQLFYGFILLILSSNLAAQNTSNETFLKLLAQPNNQADTILLRWVISDPSLWKEAVEKGYNLSRFTTHQNGISLSGADIRNSHSWITSNLFPLTEPEWDSQFPNDNNFAMVAKGTLYEQDTSTTLANGEILRWHNS